MQFPGINAAQEEAFRRLIEAVTNLTTLAFARARFAVLDRYELQ